MVPERAEFNEKATKNKDKVRIGDELREEGSLCITSLDNKTPKYVT